MASNPNSKSNDVCVKAELALSLSCDNVDDYAVTYEGLFYRGYMSDLIRQDNGLREISLSRNGLQHVLPEGLLHDENQLHRCEKDAESLKHEIALLKEQKEYYRTFFRAFDTLYFQQSFQLEQVVSHLETNKDLILLREIYGFDYAKEQNPYIRKLALLLLDSELLKGNVHLLSFFVRAILGEQIEVQIRRCVMPENAAVHYRQLRYILYIKGLSTTEYCFRMSQYKEFFDTYEQWFLPFDFECDYCIKDPTQRFVLGESLTLDYNTYFLP